MAFRTLDDLPADLRGHRVLLRGDLNVPVADGHVSDDTRVRALVPTVRDLTERGAAVLVLSHFGRPKGHDERQSLHRVAKALSGVLGRPVTFVHDCVGEVAARESADLRDGDVALLENTRFHAGEEANDPAFAAELAKLGDMYVNDAFSAAHRAHASTEGVARLLPAYAGRAMQAELDALERALGNPQRPVAAMVGGAKVSTKLDALKHLVGKVDHLMIGGGMANTFLAARGVDVGKSLCEHELNDQALDVLAAADASGCTVHLPYDVVVAREFKAGAEHRVANVHEVEADEMILDLGPSAVEALADALKTCATLVWNGPLGAFELPPFDAATLSFARHAAAQTQAGALISVAGGGDTVAALAAAGVTDQLSYVSTAGGAFLEWMEGRALPGVEALRAA